MAICICNWQEARTLNVFQDQRFFALIAGCVVLTTRQLNNRQKWCETREDSTALIGFNLDNARRKPLCYDILCTAAGFAGALCSTSAVATMIGSRTMPGAN